MAGRLMEPARGSAPVGEGEARGCLGPLVFAIFLFAGVVIFYAVFWEPVVGTVASSRWVMTPCVIVTSRIEVVTPRSKDAQVNQESVAGSKRYVPEVRYSYRYNGGAYQGTRIWFIRPTYNTLHEAEAVVRRYPKGKEAVCYVDPKQPGSATLERGFKPDLLIGLVPLGLAVTGLIGLAVSLGRSVVPAYVREEWQRRRNLAAESRRRQRGRRRVYAPGGPFSFRPHHDGKAMPFFFLFALIWNGLMVFLVREVIDAWQGGVPGCYGWLLTMFSAPLVLLGVMALIPPVYWVMKLFNPRPTLRLSSARVELGGEIAVRWRIWGNAGRIRRLRVFVEGREEATYTRGGNTFTDYEVFAVIPLADANKASEIRSGEAKLRMAEDGVPTFHGEHNKVVWMLRIHGQTGPWPDVDEEFELEVVPAQTRQAIGAGQVVE